MGQIFLSDRDELERLISDKRIFLVHTKSFEKLYIREWLQKSELVEFTDFTPNPKFDEIERAVSGFDRSGCDFIMAVGGGSAIDTAKCIKLFAGLEKADYLDKEKWKVSTLPLLAIPTTAGSGSESTKHAVAYKDGIKQSISFDSILPDYVYLDGKFLKGLPEYQKKSTMLDALCQAIESFWSVRANDESMEYSRKSIDLIKDNWKAYLDGNEEAAELIMQASNLSGRAINITTTTAAHAMSYGITSRYKIPHGHAVALCMISVWRDLLKREDFIDKMKLIDRQLSYNEFVEMMKKMKMTDVCLSVADGDLEALVLGVNPERLGNHPVELSKDDIRKMYKEMLKIED